MSSRGSITLAELVGKLDLLETNAIAAIGTAASVSQALSRITAQIRGCRT